MFGNAVNIAAPAWDGDAIRGGWPRPGAQEAFRIDLSVRSDAVFIGLEPPSAGELRLRTPESTDLEQAIENVYAIVEAHPRVLAEPVPSVLVDHSAADDAIEIVVIFSTAKDETAAVKSDLIKEVHTALDAAPGRWPYAEQRRHGTRDDGSLGAPGSA